MFFSEKIPYHLIKAHEFSFPRMLMVKQRFDDCCADDVALIIREEIGKLNLPELNGKRIAITAGSRGIPNMQEALRTIGSELKLRGAVPFIVPAMGSHGGGNAEGQLELLRSLGITEESMRMPILSSMQTVLLGTSPEGVRVYCDANAYNADGIVVCNRVKPHTDFRSNIESGICKMMVVGLGKHDGADAFHKTGAGDMGSRLKGASRIFLDKTNVLFGLALVDNPYHKTRLIKALSPDNIFEEEAALLSLAAKSMARILIHDIDVLIVDEFGKEISGCGMDPNVTGRFVYAPGLKSPDYPDADKIVLLRTTKISHGNASGLGVADFISNKFARTIDLASIYTNCLNSRYSLSAKIPMVMNNDLDTIYAAASACGKTEIKDVRIVRIHNTLELDHIWVSENYLPEVEKNPALEIVTGPAEMEFDADGNLIDLA